MVATWTCKHWIVTWIVIGCILMLVKSGEPLVSCPPADVWKSLLTPVNGGSDQGNRTESCDCSPQTSPVGWEITCYRDMDKHETGDNSVSISTLTHDDYGYNSLPTSFTIRYTQGNSLEIDCDQGLPVYKPAMFQAFRITEVDSFLIINCPLPNLSLSHIFHRTSVSTYPTNNWPEDYKFNGHNGVDGVIKVKSLKLEAKISTQINIDKLRNLLAGLDTLEQLSLKNFYINAPAARSNRIKRSLPAITPPSSHHESMRATTFRTTSTSPPTEVPILSSVSTPEFTSTSSQSAILRTQSLKVDTTKVTSENSVTWHSSKLPLPPTSSMTTMAIEVFTTQSSGSGEDLNKPATAFDPLTSEQLTPGSLATNRNRVSSTVEASDAKLQQGAGSGLGGSGSTKRLDFGFAHFFPNLKVLTLKGFITISDALDPHLSAFESGEALREILENLNQLEILDMKSNRLTQLNQNVFKDSQKLTRLYLSNNQIRHIDQDAFAHLENLQILDLFNNALVTLPNLLLKDLTNLEYFRSSTNKFARLPSDLFAYNAKLKAVDFSQNFNLIMLPVTIFKGLNNLQNVSFSDCNLTRISSADDVFFQSVPNLEKLEMRNNRFRNLTMHNMFGWNPKLKKLDISFNDIDAISSEIFSSNSTNLIELNLHGNELHSLPSNLFFYLKKLQVLKLGLNELKQINSEWFLHLNNLQELYLRNNSISRIKDETMGQPFGLGSHLRIIDLSANNMSDFSQIETINWSFYTSLKKLNLCKNNYDHTVNIPVFYSTAESFTLDLSENFIKSVSVKSIVDHELSISQLSKGGSFFDRSLGTTSQVTVMIDKNPLKCDCNLEPFVRYTRMPTYSDDSSRGYFKRVLFDISSHDTLCNEPESLSRRQLFDVNLNDLTCEISHEKQCPRKCQCFYRAADSTFTVDCIGKGLQSIPAELLKFYNFDTVDIDETAKTVKGVVVQLEHNKIKEIAAVNELINSIKVPANSRLSKTPWIKLYFNNNIIEEIPKDLFSSLGANGNLNSSQITPKIKLIKVMSLRHNKIKFIPMKILNQFSDLESSSMFNQSHDSQSLKLFLGKNPYNCTPEKVSIDEPLDCIMGEFKNWLTSNFPIVGDVSEIKCAEPFDQEAMVITQVSDDKLCPVERQDDPYVLMMLSIVSIVLALALLLVSILYYRNKQTVLAFIYIHLNPIFVCLHFSEEDIDEEKLYDAFVSYSSADRDVIMDLIEKLEKPNSDISAISILQQSGQPSIHEMSADQIVPEMNHGFKSHSKSNKAADGENDYFKLCIHERDWLPGNLISWNIVNSVQNSRRTILVLSKEFIQSIWFQVEFHTAYYQMLEDKIDRLIVIVKGELPPKEELDKDLVFLLTTKTYLVWDEKWFWEKLRYALPHKKGRRNVKETQNMMTLNSSTLKSNTMNTPAFGVTSSSSNKSKTLSKAEIMKDYVDQTIANHFQLGPAVHSTPIDDNKRRNEMPSRTNKYNNNGHTNDSFVIETQT